MYNNQPKISVILPAYNAERFLKDAIDSIIIQTYSDFELIIINDGSTDCTEDIILSYNDPRIVYVKNEKNLGLISTLNKGIDISRGKYIARMDADDISLPERFSKQINYLEQNPDIAMVSSNVFIMDEHGKSFYKSIRFLPFTDSVCKFISLFESPFPHPTCMFRSEKLKFYKYSAEQYALYAEDYDLWCRMINNEEKLFILNDCLLKYRVFNQSICGLNRNIQVNNTNLISRIALRNFYRTNTVDNKIQEFLECNNFKQLKLLMCFINQTKDKYSQKELLKPHEESQYYLWLNRYLVQKAQNFGLMDKIQSCLFLIYTMPKSFVKCIILFVFRKCDSLFLKI